MEGIKGPTVSRGVKFPTRSSANAMFVIFKRSIYLRTFYWVFSTSTYPFIIKITPGVRQHHLLSASNQNSEKAIFRRKHQCTVSNTISSLLCHGMKLDIRYRNHQDEKGKPFKLIFLNQIQYWSIPQKPCTNFTECSLRSQLPLSFMIELQDSNGIVILTFISILV